MAAAQATKEGLWLRLLFAELRQHVGILQVFSDNQAAIKLLQNPISSNRSKHIDIIYHFARDRVARGEVTFTYVRTDINWADILTKPPPLVKLEACSSGMGIY